MADKPGAPEAMSRAGNLSRGLGAASSPSSHRLRCKSSPDSSSAGTPAPPSVQVDISTDAQGTAVCVRGRHDLSQLSLIASALSDAGLAVRSATLGVQIEGEPCDVYHVTASGGSAVPEEEWGALREALLSAARRGARSTPARIHGAAAEDDSRALKTAVSEADARALEQAAADMATAAAALVAVERAILAAMDEGKEGEKASAASGEEASAALGEEASASTQAPPPKAASPSSMQASRAEAGALLERRMAAMEAILTSRRELLAKAAAAEPELPDFVRPQPTKTTGPASGSGYEIILQAFNWESCKEPWWRKLAQEAQSYADAGFTALWLPPPTDSVSTQGYLPRDLYSLESRYGSEAELRALIAKMHDLGLKAVADIVINHRCAHYQGDDGKWNKFGGRLSWDKSYVCSNNPAFGGTGACKADEDYPAAPNLDHSQERLRRDLTEWMSWLRHGIGFDGWRFDYVKGYDGRWVGHYVDATVPELAIGEFWDTCSYTDGVLNYNQDGHRQRTVDWCDATGSTSAAFDFTLKGVLQEALQRREYWRLIDAQGRPPGVLGIWPSRSITFLENHDTGSTLQHWPFPWDGAGQGYAYILTHPGTPCVFYDHFVFDEKLRKIILELVAVRRRMRLHAKSNVKIVKAYADLYAAVVDQRVAIKMGGADWSPQGDRVDPGSGRAWKLASSGTNFAVWTAER